MYEGVGTLMFLYVGLCPAWKEKVWHLFEEEEEKMLNNFNDPTRFVCNWKSVFIAVVMTCVWFTWCQQVWHDLWNLLFYIFADFGSLHSHLLSEQQYLELQDILRVQRSHHHFLVALICDGKPSPCWRWPRRPWLTRGSPARYMASCTIQGASTVHHGF